MAADRTFPILLSYNHWQKITDIRKDGGFVLFVALPWGMIAPHERQADANHGQTLKRLAERGGLSACEAVAVLDDRKWEAMPESAANARLLVLMNEWNAGHNSKGET